MPAPPWESLLWVRSLVRTSVQRGNANYFGRYLEQEIRAIPEADRVAAIENREPAALVIGQQPYMRQITQHLVDVGLYTPDDEPGQNEREKALEILNANPYSNLGWRIILSCGDERVAAERVCAAAEQRVPLFDVIPEEERRAVLEEAAGLEQPVEEESAKPPEDAFNVKLTSFEGSKGLSAQHVFLIGLHEGDLPRVAQQIQDIEICRFVVGLTRTKKKCSLLHTRNFAGNFKNPSVFLDWIDQRRFNRINVNRDYWNHPQ